MLLLSFWVIVHTVSPCWTVFSLTWPLKHLDNLQTFSHLSLFQKAFSQFQSSYCCFVLLSHCICDIGSYNCILVSTISKIKCFHDEIIPISFITTSLAPGSAHGTFIRRGRGRTLHRGERKKREVAMVVKFHGTLGGWGGRTLPRKKSVIFPSWWAWLLSKVVSSPFWSPDSSDVSD